jgi:hypothetical protein
MSATNIDEAVAAARDVMAAHFNALNARDETALATTLHFPHHRLSGGVLRTWDGADAYFSDFLARAGDGWHHSTLDSVDVFAAGADKVHLDVRFTRHRADDGKLGSFQSLWVIAKLKGRWAAQLRSSFAA